MHAERKQQVTARSQRRRPRLCIFSVERHLPSSSRNNHDDEHDDGSSPLSHSSLSSLISTLCPWMAPKSSRAQAMLISMPVPVPAPASIQLKEALPLRQIFTLRAWTAPSRLDSTRAQATSRSCTWSTSSATAWTPALAHR